jgi:hypothetical protein
MVEVNFGWESLVPYSARIVLPKEFVEVVAALDNEQMTGFHEGLRSFSDESF